MSTHTTDIVFLNMLFVVTFEHDEDHCETKKLLHKDEDILPLFEEDSDTLLDIEAKCMDYLNWLGVEA
jgi:hypothetical protein